MSERILLIGSDARTHALAWKMRQDCPDGDIRVTPGNPGIAKIAECVDIPLSDIEGLTHFGATLRPDLTIVGPEAPLIAGIVNRFQVENLAILGPTRAAAQLEGSKIWANDLMDESDIPHAKGAAFYEGQTAEALESVRLIGAEKIVIKPDGLCAGKGVVLPENMDEAEEAIKGMMSGEKFGEAGKRILIQERLEGQEFSVMAVVGANDQYTLLPIAKDNKRLRDPELPYPNPNTGGMGGYAPMEFGYRTMGPVRKYIIERTLAAMRARGVPYQGILYFGLMKTNQGTKVLEFNVRSGDPETEVQAPLVANLYETFLSAATGGELKAIKFRPGYTAGVVLAASGYPDNPRTGDRIYGLNSELGVDDEDTFIFHAGTRMSPDGLETSGGRILEVVSYDEKSPEAAFARSYSHIGPRGINFNGMHYRFNLLDASA